MKAWKGILLVAILAGMLVMQTAPRTRSGRLVRLAVWRVARAALSFRDQPPVEPSFQHAHADGDVDHWRSL